MSHLPADYSTPTPPAPVPTDRYEHWEAAPRRFSLPTLLRHRWVILGCLMVVLTITFVLTSRATPLYEGATTLRIEEQEPNLPEVFRRIQEESRFETEMEILRSRSLAAGVVADLALQLSIAEPDGAHRSDVFKELRISDSATLGSFALVRTVAGEFTLMKEGGQQTLATVRPGERLRYDGVSFVLGAAALEHPYISYSLRARDVVAARLSSSVSVEQANRDVSLVRVSYRSADQDLAWQVPEALVQRYIAQRQALQDARSAGTVTFLRQQLETISEQLAVSERDLQLYRERYTVIDPQAEGSSQVSRLISMQTQRSMLDNERAALASLIADVDMKAARARPGDGSPYRRLLAFPTLLESQAATGLLHSLTAAEDQRKALLSRRTTEDPDVQALDARIAEVEKELRSMAATYMQGLSNQVSSLDKNLADFQRELRSIPQKQLQFARLERQPKVLEGVYSMLQTRLKEAEVAAAARDPSVRVVDPAVRPLRPVSPDLGMNLMAATVCGLLLGIGLAFALEFLDKAVRSRADVRASTGLPVIGMIPRIKSTSGPLAVIADRSTRKFEQLAPPPPPPPTSSPPRRPTYTYTFLKTEDEPQEESRPATPAQPPRPPRDRLILTVPLTAGAMSEAYGIVQTNIAFGRRDRVVKVLVFTSPLSGDGKTTTVVNLAISLAQRGLKVLLLDADLRKGLIHAAFGVPRQPGLSEVLSEAQDLSSVCRSAVVGEQGTLHFVTTGKLMSAGVGFAATAALRQLLERAREDYDVVIIDTPPVNVITDAAVIGADADGVVLIARAGVTDSAALTYAVEQLTHVGAPVLGVVLNDIKPGRDSYYDSAYRYFGTYSYSATEES